MGYGSGMTTSNNAAEPEVLYEVADHIATITLNAPGRLNTISGRMLDELSAALLKADRDREVRCIVLTGAGKAFCAGLDIDRKSTRLNSSH